MSGIESNILFFQDDVGDVDNDLNIVQEEELEVGQNA